MIRNIGQEIVERRSEGVYDVLSKLPMFGISKDRIVIPEKSEYLGILDYRLKHGQNTPWDADATGLYDDIANSPIWDVHRPMGMFYSSDRADLASVILPLSLYLRWGGREFFERLTETGEFQVVSYSHGTPRDVYLIDSEWRLSEEVDLYELGYVFRTHSLIYPGINLGEFAFAAARDRRFCRIANMRIFSDSREHEYHSNIRRIVGDDSALAWMGMLLDIAQKRIDEYYFGDSSYLKPLTSVFFPFREFLPLVENVPFDVAHIYYQAGIEDAGQILELARQGVDVELAKSVLQY